MISIFSPIFIMIQKILTWLQTKIGIILNPLKIKIIKAIKNFKTKTNNIRLWQKITIIVHFIIRSLEFILPPIYLLFKARHLWFDYKNQLLLLLLIYLYTPEFLHSIWFKIICLFFSIINIIKLLFIIYMYLSPYF